ncbi:MAG: response regulator [Pirellulales bacterium]
MPLKNPPLVLLVEDSPDDVDFARRALARSGVAHRLIVAEHGDRALALLTGAETEPGCDSPWRPALVLLDLNIPGLGGRELLARIKGDPELCSIPVVIFSTSEHYSDITSCYRAHANSYHVKSDDLLEYQETARKIMEYWLSAVMRQPGAGELSSEATLAAGRQAGL